MCEFRTDEHPVPNVEVPVTLPQLKNEEGKVKKEKVKTCGRRRASEKDKQG